MSEITLLDGSIGQELVKRSGEKPTNLWSTTVMLDDSKLLSEVHDEYFSMGATVATTNTYPVLKDRLERVGLEGRLEELWDTAIETAISSKKRNGYGQVAGSIGPLHASYRPDLIPDAIEASKQYKNVIAHLSAKCDVLLIETVSSIEHAKAALIAAKDVKIPVWIAFSTEDYDGTKLRSGEDLSLNTNLILF
jgi:homocysteine S-methyltransferase